MRSRETKATGALPALLVLGAAFGMGCGSDETTCNDTVISRADPGAMFFKYATFAVMPTELYPNTLPADVQTNLTQANTSAASELEKNGFVQLDATQNPDLYLFSLSKTTDETAMYLQCTGDYWYGYWGWTWDSCAWLMQTTAQYEVGTVIVGLADPALQMVAYGGAVQGVLACGDDVSSRVDSGVRTIMANYPYYLRASSDARQ